MNEKESNEATSVGESGACPECKTQFVAEAKFCMNCGFKLAA